MGETSGLEWKTISEHKGHKVNLLHTPSLLPHLPTLSHLSSYSPSPDIKSKEFNLYGIVMFM